MAYAPAIRRRRPEKEALVRCTPGKGFSRSAFLRKLSSPTLNKACRLTYPGLWRERSDLGYRQCCTPMYARRSPGLQEACSSESNRFLIPTSPTLNEASKRTYRRSWRKNLILGRDYTGPPKCGSRNPMTAHPKVYHFLLAHSRY